MTPSLLARARQWLEDRGWWYGRLKPCDCPRTDRYWGLQSHPPECVRVNDGAEQVEQETDAARVLEWQRTITWRCRNCGEQFTQHTGVAIQRVVEFEDGTVERDPTAFERVNEVDG